jgi:transposase
MTEEKKIGGVKIHLGTDILGTPYMAAVTTANVGDREGALAMIKQSGIKLRRLEKLLCDGNYTGDEFALAVYRVCGARVEVVTRPELHRFEVIPKRWVVERSFGWLDKCRRLWKNCERLIESTLAMVKLVFISVLLRRY